MQLQQTKTGKIHLASDANITKCTVTKKLPGGKTIQHEGVIDPATALELTPSSFCKKCFGKDPAQAIDQIIAYQAPASNVEIRHNGPRIVPEPRQPRRVIVDQNQISGNDITKAIDSMINRLEAFSKNEAYTTYKRFKASYYVESFYAIRDMIQNNDVQAINRVMERLV